MTLTDSHLYLTIKICIPMNVIAQKLEYAAEVWEENAKLVKKLKTGQMTAARKIPGCWTRNNIAVLGIRIGLSAPTADRPYSGFSSTSDELRNVCGAGIGPSVGTVIMPYTRQGLSMRTSKEEPPQGRDSRRSITPI